jgi:hydroxyacylglutathione hydrolase
VRNWAFRFAQDEKGFVNYLLEDQPEPPYYFAMMKKLNKVNRPLLTSVPQLKQLSNQEMKDAMAKGIKLIDVRNKVDFANGFIPGSINIQGNNSFATWAGWFLTYDEPFMLLAAPSQLDDVTRKLMRIGLDNIMGYVPSTEAFIKEGGQLEKANVITIDEFKKAMAEPNVQVVDLRNATEYKSGHVKGADHVFIGTMMNNLNKISKDKKVLIHCQGGDRSTIGYSLLRKEGYTNVYNYSASMNEWIALGNPVEN